MLSRVEELPKDLQHEDASTASAVNPATSRLSHPTLQNPTAFHPKPQAESAYPKAIRFNGDRSTDEIHIQRISQALDSGYSL